MSRVHRLQSISLRDFKSVADQSVALGPLTAVVGANSAGKSTLLQAILALAQAVRSEADTAEFPLNGPLIRLGTFAETHNLLADQATSPFELGFELFDDSPIRPRRSRFLEDHDLDSDDDPALGQLQERIIQWHAFVKPVDAESSTGGHGFAQIDRLRLTISSQSGELAYACDLNPQDDQSPDAERLRELRIIGGPRMPGPRPGFRLRPLPVQGRVSDYVTAEGAPLLDAVALSGGVPFEFFQETTQLDDLAESWWTTATSVLEDVETAGELEPELIVDDEDLPDIDDLVKVARRYAIDHIRALVDGTDADVARIGGRAMPWTVRDRSFLPQMTRLLGRLESEERARLRRSLEAQGEATFRAALRDELLGDDSDLDMPVLRRQAGEAVDYLMRSGQVSQRFFASSIRYLGPLREAPNVLYDPGPGQTDIGSKGEYAAAVLHSQADSRVVMPQLPGTSRVHGLVSLNDALNAWLSWFGLADRATAEDRGRLGIGLSVTPSALGQPVDLTSVGVGVSQVLPVVLVCLLARPGTLVVLEQPELHLHPKLQQDLADFFLACVESGRQIVLETHSEHLVNRLRRRVAGDESDATRELVKLIFAENSDGITTYRESAVNTYGGLDDDWPDGFLDLGARESRALIKESAAKRRREITGDAD